MEEEVEEENGGRCRCVLAGCGRGHLLLPVLLSSLTYIHGCTYTHTNTCSKGHILHLCVYFHRLTNRPTQLKTQADAAFSERP